MHHGSKSRGRCGHGLTRGRRGWALQGTAAHQLKSVEERHDFEPIKSLARLAENWLRNADEKKMLPVSGAAENNLVAVIDAGKCTLCGRCVQVCPAGAITVDTMVNIDTGKCTECGKCVSVCPREAITIKRV
jgi:ferredoxin